MKAIEILNNHDLKRTSCREGIIEVIMTANQALSENEIREQLAGNYDRTTFYRSFKTLEEHKIIHKIVVDNLLVKYELDNSVTRKKKHAHFYCNGCEALQCLDNIEITQPAVPTGYKVHGLELIVKGFCAECSINS